MFCVVLNLSRGIGKHVQSWHGSIPFSISSQVGVSVWGMNFEVRYPNRTKGGIISLVCLHWSHVCLTPVTLSFDMFLSLSNSSVPQFFYTTLPNGIKIALNNFFRYLDNKKCDKQSSKHTSRQTNGQTN